MNGTSTNNSVQSVERALNILLIIADETLPVSIARIVECSGLNRTTVWRLLVTLEDCGFVEKDPISKGYLLGYNASRLCSDIMDNYAPLIRLAKPYMDKLLDEINEDILLTVPRFGGMLTIYQLHSDNAVLIRDYSMMLSQFHSSSNGKIYLSFLEPEELDLILSQPLEKTTPYTITDPAKLRKEIEQCRRENCGFTLEENGVGENGFSIPILYQEKPYAFLNVSGPSFRFTEEKMRQYVPLVQKICKDIEEKLIH